MKCKKHKLSMKLVRTEWVDDNHGNCGNVKMYQCKLGCEDYKSTDDGFSYNPPD